MHDAVATLPLQQGLAAWRADRSRESDLLRLASDVEHEHPGLACELRGIAMHEAAAAGRKPAPHTSAWQRAGRWLWRELEAVGRHRAARELRELADRWATTDPALAKALREACEREG